MSKWLDVWNTEEHDNNKLAAFKILDKHLTKKPINILDIGCGLAKESELFQKNYNSNLWLLDGEFGSNVLKKRQVKYGNVNNFNFYNKIDELKQSWDSRNIKYNFVDANNILLDESIKFDLVYSSLSCGFHYPAEIYRDLILKHSHANTKIIFDLRHKNLFEQKVKVINILFQNKKYITAEIEFT